jgi:hypothetical protein
VDVRKYMATKTIENDMLKPKSTMEHNPISTLD